MKRKLAVSALVFSALATLCLTEGRLYAMHVYGAPCGQASGFAGFLQKTHFLPSGGCGTQITGSCGNRTCTVTNPVSGGSTSGTCKPVQGSTTACACVAN
jgi:hypothetical protein